MDHPYMQIPEHIGECMKYDAQADRIMRFAELLRLLKIALTILTLVGGLLSTLLVLPACHENIKTAVLVGGISGTIIASFWTYLIFNAISIHFFAQANIVNNTKVSAKLAAFELSQKDEKQL